MDTYYPGAEPECDGCPQQQKVEVTEWDFPELTAPYLFCYRYPVPVIYFCPECITVRSEA